jgi:hypothetical protein
MKYLIILITALICMSCNNTPIKVDDSASNTSVEEQTIVQNDTICYKVIVTEDDVLEVFDSETNLKVYKLKNESSNFFTALMIVAIMMTLLIAIIISIND